MATMIPQSGGGGKTSDDIFFRFDGDTPSGWIKKYYGVTPSVYQYRANPEINFDSPNFDSMLKNNHYYVAYITDPSDSNFVKIFVFDYNNLGANPKEFKFNNTGKSSSLKFSSIVQTLTIYNGLKRCDKCWVPVPQKNKAYHAYTSGRTWTLEVHDNNGVIKRSGNFTAPRDSWGTPLQYYDDSSDTLYVFWSAYAGSGSNYGADIGCYVFENFIDGTSATLTPNRTTFVSTGSGFSNVPYQRWTYIENNILHTFPYIASDAFASNQYWHVQVDLSTKTPTLVGNGTATEDMLGFYGDPRILMCDISDYSGLQTGNSGYFYPNKMYYKGSLYSPVNEILLNNPNNGYYGTNTGQLAFAKIPIITHASGFKYLKYYSTSLDLVKELKNDPNGLLLIDTYRGLSGSTTPTLTQSAVTGYNNKRYVFYDDATQAIHKYRATKVI